MMGKTHRAGAVLLAFPMLFPVLKFTSTSPTDAVAISLFLGGSLLTSRLMQLHPPLPSWTLLCSVSWTVSRASMGIR